MTPYVTLLVALVFERIAAAWDRGERVLFTPPSRANGRPVEAWPIVLGLVALYAIELGLVAWSAGADHAATRALGFPIAIADDRGVAIDARREVVSLVLTAIVALQCILLFALWRALNAAGATQRIVWAGVSACVALSLAAPATTSGDLYSYVGYALLGHAAYAPPPASFGGEFRAINGWWGTPIPASPYGPLWLAYAGTLLAPIPGLLAKIEMLRLSNVAWLAIAVFLLRLGGAGSSSLALIAINPALQLQFIAGGHNDIVAITLALGAWVAARRFPILAAALAVAAALVKLPFAVLVLPAFAQLTVRARALLCGAAMLAAAALSYALGGLPYLSALAAHAHERTHFASPAHSLVAVAAVAAIGAAVMGRRWSLAAAFSFPALGAGLFPWYASWGLMYAATADRLLPWFAILLPAATLLCESFVDTRFAIFAVIAALALVASGRCSAASSRRCAPQEHARASMRGRPSGVG
jgi:hypothetical protein